MKKRGFKIRTPMGRILQFRTKSENIVYYPVTGGNILFDKDTGTVTGCDWYVTEANIPEMIEGVPVTSIGNCAFQCPICRLTSVTIPETVTSIGSCAFYCCDSLRSVWIPDSVTSIGNTAFYCCDSLSCVIISNSVTCIGNAAFYGCTGLTDVYYNGTGTEYKANLFPKVDHNNDEFLNATFHFKNSPSQKPGPDSPLPSTAAKDNTTRYGPLFVLMLALTISALALSRWKKV